MDVLVASRNKQTVPFFLSDHIASRQKRVTNHDNAMPKMSEIRSARFYLPYIVPVAWIGLDFD
jgi:hypothetical protein